MINAQNPEEIPNSNIIKEDVISKVPGFSTPVIPTADINNSNQPNSQSDPNSTSIPEIDIDEEKLTPEWKKLIFYWWHKIALGLLILHGLSGLWDSIYFILFEYSELNMLLELHQVDISKVNELFSKAIITFIATFVNVLFAIRLSKVKEATAHNVDLIVATFLVITTKLIQNFLVQLDLVNYFLELFSK